jgi:hypothetical protein
MLYDVMSESLIEDLNLKFEIELDREEDGRCVAEMASRPGVMAHGKPKLEVVIKVKGLCRPG